MKNDWAFRYGSTPWVGPYPTPEAAACSADDSPQLTEEEKGLVVAAVLAVNGEFLQLCGEVSQVTLLLSGSSQWYIRVARKGSSA